MSSPVESRAAALGASIWPEQAGVPALEAGDRVHLVGVGGAGMSGLAGVLLELGLEVSGSDRQDSALLRELASRGLRAFVGHAAAQIPEGCRLLVHSPAIGPENPELVAAARAGIPITKRAPLLGAWMDRRVGIAVAGTHGKTTTSGMIACILRAAGLAPGYFIGGLLPDLGGNASLGGGPHLVIEADEYDRSFLHGHPALAVITNLEHDHPDIYPTEAELVEAFARFAARVARKPRGLLLVNAAWPLALKAAQRSGARIETYHVAGDPEPALADERDPGQGSGSVSDWQAVDLRRRPGSTRFEVLHDGASLGGFELSLPGLHNVGNALAALAIAHHLGVELSVTRRVLASFRGAGRRFEPLGRISGIELVDDYAHHPTEIAASLEAARQQHPGGRLLAVVEPHTFSRVASLRPAFREVLERADHSIVTPIYAAREVPLAGVDAESLVRDLPGVESVASLEAAAERCAEVAAPGDLLIFMGAGRITEVSRNCLRLLRRAAVDRLLEDADRLGLGGEIERGASLARYTTLRVGGPAELLVRVRRLDDLAGWWRLARTAEIPLRVIGRGSNLVIADEGLPGLVLVNRCEDWEIETAPADSDVRTAVVRADSGLTLAALAHSLARLGWSGLESSVGIPGSLGAAVVTNAGAHGWEMADSLVQARILAPDGQERLLGPEDLDFRYRGSWLKDRSDHLLLDLRLRLERDDPEAIRSRIARCAAHRRDTQPREPSVGSIFKNPDGDFAGRLIESVGLKGESSGGARISPVHANFIVNESSATAADILRLLELARQRVARERGIEMETEIEILGVPDAR